MSEPKQPLNVCELTIDGIDGRDISFKLVATGPTLLEARADVQHQAVQFAGFLRRLAAGKETALDQSVTDILEASNQKEQREKVV